MTRAFSRRLMHIALCAALAPGAMAPLPAFAETPPVERQQPGNGAAVLVLGIAAIALLAHLNTKAGTDDRHRDTPPEQDQTPARDRIDSREIEPRIVVPRPDPRAIPIHCLKRARTHDGPVRLYMRHCLHLAGVPVHHLPAACDRRVRAHDGTLRRGFAPGCLERHGHYLPRAR